MPTKQDIHDAILDSLFDALDEAETDEEAQAIAKRYRALLDDDDAMSDLAGDGIQESESFFANCSRDEHGHCKTGTGGSSSKSDSKDSDSTSDAPLTADEKKEAKAAWADHAKAKEAHAKEVESLEASHAKAMEEHAAKVKDIDVAHAEVVKAHEAKVAEIEASHAKATKEWEARDEARTSRRDAAEADHVSDAMDKAGGVKSKPPSHDEASKREDYEASAKAHADEHQTQWDAAYGESGHLAKSLDSVGATGKEKERVAALADRGKQAIERAGAKYQKAVAKHADAVDAVKEHREKMPDEPVEPDPPGYEPAPPDEIGENASVEEKEQYKKEYAEYESDHAQWEKDTAAYDKAFEGYEKEQEKFDKADEKLSDLEEKANDLESEAMDAADALDTTLTEHQEKLTDAVSKIQERIGGDIDKEEAKDQQPDYPELPDEPDEPDYPDEPDEPDYPDEPDEPDLPHPDTFEDVESKEK